MKRVYSYCSLLILSAFYTAFSLSILHATEKLDFIESMAIKRNAVIKQISIKQMQESPEYRHFSNYLDEYPSSEENKKNIRSIWVNHALKFVRLELDPFTVIFSDLEEKLSGKICLLEGGAQTAIWNKTKPFEKGPFERIYMAFKTSTANYVFVKNNLEKIYIEHLIYDFLFGKDTPFTELYKVSYKTLERQSTHVQRYCKNVTFSFQKTLRKLECCKWDKSLSFDDQVNSFESFFRDQQIRKNWRAKISEDLFNETLDCMVNAYKEHKDGLTEGKIVIKTNVDVLPALKKLQEEGGLNKIKQEDQSLSQEVTAETPWDRERVNNLKHLYPRFKKEKNQAVKMKMRDARALGSNQKEKAKEKEKDLAVDKPLTSSNRMDPGFTRSAYEKLIALKDDERWESLDSNLKSHVEEYIEMYQNMENAKAKRSLKALYKQLFKLMNLQRSGKGSHKVLYFLFAKDASGEDKPGSEKVKEK